MLGDSFSENPMVIVKDCITNNLCSELVAVSNDSKHGELLMPRYIVMYMNFGRLREDNSPF